jgi:hypothetical protein
MSALTVRPGVRSTKIERRSIDANDPSETMHLHKH